MAEDTSKWLTENPGAAFLLSDNAASAWLGISRATFWRRVNDGTLPKPIKIGGATRWRRDELMGAVEKAAATRGVKTAV